ncbi:MAG: TIGR00341 family protein [bacterium]
MSNLFNLHRDEDDQQKTLESVKKNISFTGPNLWILACAIFVCSIGLNVNSTAVIIGAMLISPLMGPIVGSGFALGIYDFDLLKKSLRNLFIATIAGLIVSTIYFYISPFKEARSELLGRTSPNIYDVLIAFFGGLVGVIAVTRVEKGNPIPGVAIATALMPPLCTAGFGLATGNLNYFFGSLFLYTINCVFICIATFAIVKYLKYPAKKIDVKHEKQVKYGIMAIVILMILPSAYFAYSLYNRQKFLQSVNKFIETEFNEKGNTVIYKKTSYNQNPKTIELAFLIKRFSPDEIQVLNEKFSDYGLSGSILIIRQDSTEDIQNLKNDILNEVKNSENKLGAKDIQIKTLKEEIARNTFDNKEILAEANTIFPDISSLSLANHTSYAEGDSNKVITVLIYESAKSLKKDDKLKFENWLKQRLSLDSLETYRK